MLVEQPFRVAYILGEYPSVTETFVTNEIRGLVGAGVPVMVLALRRGRGDHAADCPTFYRDSLPVGQSSGQWRAWPRLARDALALEAGSPSSVLAAVRNVGTAIRFAQIVREMGIPHVHAHFGFIPTDVALMIAGIERVSVSFSVHAWDVWCAGRTLPRKIGRAALCIACTEAARRHLCSLAGEPKLDKTICVYHGTDLDRFAFRPRAALSDPRRILAVGRLVPKKGFGTLLHACARLRQKMDVRCEIVGRGPLERTLRNLAEKLRLGDAVLLAGSVPHALMPEAYARADVLAVPSIVAPDGDRDGLPNVVVEAMACGVPVVASRLSGIPEAVLDGQTGLLCDPADSSALAGALERMLTDGALRSHCIQAGRTLVEEKFDAARNSRQVLEAMRSAAAGQRPPGLPVRSGC